MFLLALVFVLFYVAKCFGVFVDTTCLSLCCEVCWCFCRHLIVAIYTPNCFDAAVETWLISCCRVFSAVVSVLTPACCSTAKYLTVSLNTWCMWQVVLLILLTPNCYYDNVYLCLFTLGWCYVTFHGVLPSLFTSGCRYAMKCFDASVDTGILPRCNVFSRSRCLAPRCSSATMTAARQSPTH